MKSLLLGRALAPSTHTQYKVGIRQYLAFCRLFYIEPLPLSEYVLENFCISLSRRVKHSTIRGYLSGVQFYSKIGGCTILIKDMVRLEYVMTAIRRAQGNVFDRPTRPPVTLNMLKQLCAFINITESPFDRDMLTAAVLLAFFGLLRVSEYTSPTSSTHDPTSNLSVDDININWKRKVALIRIKKSKTDPFREGATIRIGVLNHYLCPVHALIRYLMHRGRAPGPFFVFRNGAFLTRPRIVDLLRRGLPDTPHINTHSFRRGGASALANANVPDHVIQILGRWKSNAFREYIQMSDEFLRQTNRDMIR